MILKMARKERAVTRRYSAVILWNGDGGWPHGTICSTFPMCQRTMDGCVSHCPAALALQNDSTDRQSAFELHSQRLRYLERWSELAIRPQEKDCHADVRAMLQLEVDDCTKLMNRCLYVRKMMNDNLPTHDLVLDKNLSPEESGIPNAGLGLYFRPSSPSQTVPKGEIICYHSGQIHNFHSSKTLKDKSYLMLVAGNVLVDPGPLPQIKARYINDPLSEDSVNCKYVPEPEMDRCAVVATRDIQCDEELFVSYGEAYWAQQDIRGTIYTK